MVFVINWIAKRRNKLKHTRGQVICEIQFQGDQARNELMSHLLLSDLCNNMIKKTFRAFLGLCDMS